eukprot:scaffold935_cov222-Isochrysis_galbana.AAC.1
MYGDWFEARRRRFAHTAWLRPYGIRLITDAASLVRVDREEVKREAGSVGQGHAWSWRDERLKAQRLRVRGI